MKIIKLIQQHVSYPNRARSINIQGEVLVSFEILESGLIRNIKALDGHSLLKKSAIKAVEDASRFFPKVEKNLTIKIPINYSLMEHK